VVGRICGGGFAQTQKQSTTWTYRMQAVIAEIQRIMWKRLQVAGGGILLYMGAGKSEGWRNIA